MDDLVFCGNNQGYPQLRERALDYIVKWYATYTKWDRYALHQGTNYELLDWRTKFNLLTELLKDKIIDIDECIADYLGYGTPAW